jgi:hypothetical protein
MARISVSVDNATEAAIQRAAAGGSVSRWVANLIHQALVDQAAAAAAAYDRQYDDADHEAARLGGVV